MANSIAKNIRRKGIEPRPYFRRAVVKNAPKFKETWSMMLAEKLEADLQSSLSAGDFTSHSGRKA
jgi:hypothetical protein